MPRIKNEVLNKQAYLKEQCTAVENYLNQLEQICSSSNASQKEDFVGLIGLLVGKIGIRFNNIEDQIGVLTYDEE